MSSNAYSAYGLSIEADLECPELRALPQPVSDPDVTIRWLATGDSAMSPLKDRHYEVLPGRFRLDVKGVARYSVEEGKRILIEPVGDASLEKVRLFLFGSTMGALLYQRGLFPLHGSAVETPWGAMIFVGAQGSGKSTLAAQFHKQGYRLLSDDVCAIATTPGGLRIMPALSHFRLCADAYERLQSPVEARFDVDKFLVPMGDGYCTEPVALKAIHVLSDGDASLPHFEFLQGLSRVCRLLENLYRPHFLKGQATQTGLMKMAGTIAQQSVVASVTRRRPETLPDDMLNFLIAAWHDHFDPITSVENR
jgi:hypothetical protein